MQWIYIYITYAVNICTYTHTHFGKSHMQATNAASEGQYLSNYVSWINIMTANQFEIP